MEWQTWGGTRRRALQGDRDVLEQVVDDFRDADPFGFSPVVRENAVAKDGSSQRADVVGDGLDRDGLVTETFVWELHDFEDGHDVVEGSRKRAQVLHGATAQTRHDGQ